MFHVILPTITDEYLVIIRDKLKVTIFFLFRSIDRIYSMQRRKAVAKSWFGNSKTATVSGEVEFIQQSEYDVTDVTVDLEGLSGLMSGYHVHQVSSSSTGSHVHPKTFPIRNNTNFLP